MEATKMGSDKRYERFMAKAETYLTEYKASYSAPTTTTPTDDDVTPPPSNGDVVTTRHIEFLKKAKGHLNKNKKDCGDDQLMKDNVDESEDDHEEHLKLAHALLIQIKKHKEARGQGNGSTNEEEEEQGEAEAEAEAEAEEEEVEIEEEEEISWLAVLMEGIQVLIEAGLEE